MSKLVTNSGRILDLKMPLMGAICIEDIAHHLGNIRRFNGATDRPYTVAEHSVYCSRIVEGSRRNQLHALLHDATEAYVGDCISPLKALLPDFKKIEDDIWITIALKFDLDFQTPSEVHKADTIAYVTERRELISARAIEDDPDAERFARIPSHSLPLPPANGMYPRELFLARYEELKKCLIT